MGAPVEMPLTAFQPGRYPDRFIVGPPEQMNAARNGLRGQVIGIERQHAADGIGAIKQRTGTLDDLDPVDGELVDLQPVVVTPLLSFVLDAVHRHGDAVESHAADGRFGLAGADAPRLYAGNGPETAGQCSRKMIFYVSTAHFHAPQRGVQQLLPAGFAIDSSLAEHLDGVRLRGLHEKCSHDDCYHTFLIYN